MRVFIAFILGATLVAFTGCGEEASSSSSSGATAQEASALDDFSRSYLVDVAPADPIPTTDIREFGVADAEVVTTGRIDTFVDGFAVFTIVDLKVPF